MVVHLSVGPVQQGLISLIVCAGEKIKTRLSGMANVIHHFPGSQTEMV